MSMTVAEIATKYPVGTALGVWVRTGGGPTYFGRFRVDRCTIRLNDTGRTWGELVRELYLESGWIPQISHVQMVAMYLVYEARNDGEDTTYRVAMSAVREASLRQEIAAGRRRMTLVRLVIETDDRNEARKWADGIEL